MVVTGMQMLNHCMPQSPNGPPQSCSNIADMPCTAGSTAFAVVAIGTLTYAHYYYARQIIVTVMVLLWALRLGGFLVLRVMKTGGDSRFNEVKNKPCECLCKLHPQRPSSQCQQYICNHSSLALAWLSSAAQLIAYEVQATLLPVDQ